MSKGKQFSDSKGVLAWFAQNTVAANLIMFIILIGGLVFMARTKQEVFPEVNLNWVSISVPYPGASPEEVEQGIILSIEEALGEVDGIKKVKSTASESNGSVFVQLLDATEETKALNEIKAVVDRITSFPQDSERPVISLISNRRQVISLPIYGDIDRKLLKELAEKVRDDLLSHDEISVVEISGLPAPEIAIEIPQEKMRSLGLTYDQVARSISAAAVEIPGGGIKTASGEILVRLSKRREYGEDFRDIVVLARPDGPIVRLGEIADIRDGFSENDRSSLFNGKPALSVNVYRVGAQTPISIADIVNAYVVDVNKTLPANVRVTTWADSSEMYRDRIDLLLRNSGMGLILVLLILGAFLEIRLAFWATFGIPIAFLGAFIFMNLTGISINMISLFGFLLALGIVVDDAIVVGESIYHERSKQPTFVQAAIVGVQKVSVPVVFAVATTIVAFVPMLTIPGVSGKFFQNIPGVVIPILFISLFEVFVILPAHLGHGKKDLPKILRPIQRGQESISRALERWIDRIYVPFVNLAVKNRYISLAISFALLALAVGYVVSGRIQFTFMPKIESDQVVSIVELPFGTPAAETKRVVKKISVAAKEVLEDLGGQKYGRGISSDIGKAGGNNSGPVAGFAGGGSHVGQASVRLVSSDARPFTASEFTDRWREKVGEIAGIEKITFSYSSGPPIGAPIDIRISHRDKVQLEKAGERIAEELKKFEGVQDIDDGARLGKEQLDLELTPAGIALGLTERDLARQVRSAFFGSEALRQQRGRDEMRVYVRRPIADRQSEFDIESLMLRTPRGGDIPLRAAATIHRGRSYTKISREASRRVVNVTADVDTKVTTAGEVLEGFIAEVMPQVVKDYPGLTWEKAGAQQEQEDSMKALGLGMAIALLVIFALLAVAFRSYVQPIVIMIAIPFGLVGALVGHIILGYGLSVISVMGLIALTGVVVNDSLVLIDAVNTFRDEGYSAHQSVILGGARRFRPIILTSLTTFFGLAPMILETSVQARFLVPMAISLGFGVLFVTAIALVIVPTAYMAVEDLKIFFGFGKKDLDRLPGPEVSD